MSSRHKLEVGEMYKIHASYTVFYNLTGVKEVDLRFGERVDGIFDEASFYNKSIRLDSSSIVMYTGKTLCKISVSTTTVTFPILTFFYCGLMDNGQPGAVDVGINLDSRLFTKVS